MFSYIIKNQQIMLSKIVSCLVTIVSVSALNEPACFRMGRTIIAKNLGDFGCTHIEGQYDRAYEIEDGKVIIRDIEMGGEILLELYGPSGPMILPGDECCVPTEFVVMLECVKVLPDGMGDCHRDLQTNEVVITNLPQTSNWFHTNMISCVHDIVNYGIYTPDVNGALTFEMTPADLLLNTQVELYATNGEECCMCYIISLDCPIKEPENCLSYAGDVYNIDGGFNCGSMTDAEVDQKLNNACNAAYPGSRSVTGTELLNHQDILNLTATPAWPTAPACPGCGSCDNGNGRLCAVFAPLTWDITDPAIWAENHGGAVLTATCVFDNCPQ